MIHRWGLLALVMATMGCNQIVGNNEFTISDSPSSEPGDGDGDGDLGDGDTGGTSGDGDTGGTAGDGDLGGGNSACPTTFGSAEFGSGCFE